MALEMLGFIRHHRGNDSPIRRVRCTDCGAEYARTGSASDIRRRGGCSDCMNRNRKRYASPKERKRAQNQRYYQRRKLREAGVSA